MTRRIVCAAAGAVVLLLELAALLAGVRWLTGWFPPRPAAVTVLVVAAALGLIVGGLMAHPGDDADYEPADPERDAFVAAVLADIDALPDTDDADRKESTR